MSKWLKPFGALLLMIIVCSVIVRVTTGGQTLSEYAQENPELAYATPEKTASPSPFASPSPSASPSVAPDEATPEIPSPESLSAICYEPGFFYEPLSEEIITRITGTSYPVPEEEAMGGTVPAVNIMPSGKEAAINYGDLCYLTVLHYDFEGQVQTGNLICNYGIAQDLLEIFYELYQNEYQIEKIRLIDEYDGDDTASMEDNNTSCFNYRVVDGTDSLSKHALGCAIDINPLYNPYVVYDYKGTGETYISPSEGKTYADRSLDFPYKIDEDDLCYKLFKQHGFTWGGDWNSCKDYQHFQKTDF